ncbi:helix-turn-helix transcriptional regulator [Nocardioides sp.]|jgi:DNA-binding CsgD family transcriptional regulator|uniref:helix-turn-helix transcriptional regulator n=1 Tax=Nocardioides sp. TaxID=35761 RepID=UPI002F3E3CE1
MTQAIAGRTAEIGVLDRLLADRLAEPRAVLIDGAPGIGKTTLLRVLLASAREQQYAVATCQPTRSEMELSYAGLVGLLGDLGIDAVRELPAPQARVLRTVMRLEETVEPVDRLSLDLATLAVLRAVAADRPLLVAVDDAQWLDQPTARVLAFVVRRLAGTSTRIAVVRSLGAVPLLRLGDRSAAHDDPVDWPAELGRAMAEGRFDTLEVGPVGPSDLSRILRRVLGWAPAWPRLVRIAELSQGNPLHALELTRAFGAVGSGDGLEGPLSDSVLDLARSRIAGLPDRVREALELASVPRDPLLNLLGHLDPTALDLREALEAAGRQGIVTVVDDRVRFTHPILAAATYGSIPAARRRDLHRALAMLSDNLEERARHLATAAEGPDAEVAVALEGAAEQAWLRGAPDAAADLLHLACRLTPPADAEALALRRTAYGRLMHSAGDAPGAVAELESLVGSLPEGMLRAGALFHLMYVARLSGALERAVEHGVEAAAESAGDPLFQAEVLELLSRISDNDIDRKLDAARRALEAVERVPRPDPEVVFQVRAALVEAEFYAGLGIHLERLRGLDPAPRPRFPPVRTASHGDDLVGRLLAYDGRVDEGLELLRAMYDRASIENRSILPAILGWMAEAQLMAGRFLAALDLTREAVDRAQETGGKGGLPWEVGFHAVTLARLGRVDEAESAAGQVLEAGDTVGLDRAPALLALGVVAVSRGDLEAAVAHLRTLDQLKRQAGIREPRMCAHVGDFVEALVAAGALDEASQVLARLDDEAATSRGRWSQAVAARSRAMVLAAHGDLEDAMGTADRSLQLFEGLPAPFERARALLLVGQLRRRRREKRLAREALQEALASFEDLHTPEWAERARNELARIPDHQSDGLTPTEDRVARLAADGLTNGQIAERLFLSPKTVEVNLTRIYRKLGVRRAALATRLAEIGDVGRT